MFTNNILVYVIHFEIVCGNVESFDSIPCTVSKKKWAVFYQTLSSVLFLSPDCASSLSE